VGWWDSWKLADGTIGKAYGYQIANQKRVVKYEDLSSTYQDEKSKKSGFKELDQIDWLINKIETKPDRRMIMSMFQPEEEGEKALQECAYETIWRVVGDELHMTLIQRSSDYQIAGVLNGLQYSALLMMVAQATGYKVGTFSHYISDVHLYDNQVEQAKEILERTPIDCSPRLHLNAYGKNFYDITLDDFEIEDYITHPQIKFGEIAK
jgi:thymidylate synthase